jgi:ribosomal protein L18E
MIDRKVAIGAALAVGAVLLLPGVATAAARAGRPLGKAALKTGATAYEEFKRAGAEVIEHLEDLVAEVKAEMQAKPAGEHDKGLAEEVEILAKKARSTRKP